MPNDKQTAETIVLHLGGPGIFAMAFTASMYAGSTTTLHIARPLRRLAKCSHVTVTLDHATDTYNVAVLLARGTTYRVVKTSLGVQADQLRAAVEQLTGLRLGLAAA